MLEDPRPRGAAIDDAATIDRLMDHLHWSLQAFTHRGLGAGAASVEDHAGTRFHFVLSGEIELVHDDVVYRIECGSFALLPRGGSIVIRAERDTRLLSASVELLGTHPLMIRAMPDVLFSYDFRRQEPGLASVLDTIAAEAGRARPGSSAVVAGLTDVAVSAAVRFWLEHGCGSARPWLAAANDHSLGLALAAIHAEPGSPWTVDALARVAHASRSQFAEQFRAAIGDTPARYVTRVRMTHAERMLRNGEPVSGIAYRLGYDSEDGFSRAFRRHSGVAPSRWRREREQAVRVGSAAPIGDDLQAVPAVA
ncbi:AraC family transcriptional regulator [Agromyces sp. LHK192]|uniref:helix-turn-helix transcriptional regulator n=1 Tax=Agromyces sp. LHK192 TaxID=2498704 RepID=UPI0013E345A6|nr:AraC family transcriptional regulator [Agromyces sp. LHK192]